MATVTEDKPATTNPISTQRHGDEHREQRRGRRPGDAYVRIVHPFDEEFRRGEDDGGLIATERTILERHGWKAGLRALRTWLIGRPIT